MKSFDTIIIIQSIILCLSITQCSAVMGKQNQGQGTVTVTGTPFSPRLPIRCKSSPSSLPSSSSSSFCGHDQTLASLQVSGGGSPLRSLTSKRNHKHDHNHDIDETMLSSYAQESDIKVEIRGGSTADGNLQTAQPLRISTYRTGIRQIKHSEKRRVKRLKRVEKMEKKKLKQELKSHKIYAKKLKSRNNMNIKRKVMHAGFGLFFATLNQILPREIFVPGMTILTSATLLMELLRYRKGFGWMNDVLHFVLGGTLRKQEMEGKFTGSFYYFLGVTLTSFLFPTSCASLGICQLALADPSASYFGRQTRHVYWSRIENGFFGVGRNKGVLGFLGGATFCFPFNYCVLNAAKYGGSAIIPGGQSSVALASIALGLAGAFADLCVPTPALTMPKKILGIPMPRLHVDDNVVVPIVSGYACTKIYTYLGWTQGVDLAKFFLF